MYNLTTNRDMMSPSERMENAEASCEAINDHIESIGKRLYHSEIVESKKKLTIQNLIIYVPV